jgi:hypothetical protein
VFSPPDLPEGTLDYGLPEGSVPAGNAPTGPVQWQLGNGTNTTSGYHNFAGSDLAPLTISPAFAVGTHDVTASITDAAGQQATLALTIEVFPALRARIASRRRGHTLTLRVEVSGGDGRLLAIRWRLGRSAAAGSVITHRADGGLAEVTVTDGTGTEAQARVRLPSVRG